MTIFKIGDKVMDRDGYKGIVVKITDWENSVWYDIKFPSGVAIRWDNDLVLEDFKKD